MEHNESNPQPKENYEISKPENLIGEIIIITGLSGAGKSLALKCLEDMDFFCVDNLLPALIPKFVQLCASSDMNKIALVIDVRGRRFFKELITALREIPEYGFKYQILFFEASDEILIRRFSESRRKHPLAHKGRLLDGINYERKQLEEIKGVSDRIIDTGQLSPNKLKRSLAEFVTQSESEDKYLNITVVAFGFKYGVPIDADLIYDVRFLPNPYYISELRNLTGNNEPVYNYVMEQEETNIFLKKLFDFNVYLIPQFIKEGKSTLTIGIGCTGGKHRSVVVANELTKFLESQDYKVQVEYRDSKLS